MDKSRLPHPHCSELWKEWNRNRTKAQRHLPQLRAGLDKATNRVRFLRCLCLQPRLLALSLGCQLPSLTPSQAESQAPCSHQLT